MATRRFISKEIFLSDTFVAMTPRSKALYAYLCLYADDDGCLDCVKTVLRLSGFKRSDLKPLIDKRYVLELEGDELLIKHWYKMNRIPPSKYKPSEYAQSIHARYALGEDDCYR